MINAVLGLYAWANAQRIALKGNVTGLMVHFVILLLAEMWLQFTLRTWVNPIYAGAGILWICIGVLWVWKNGSWPLDVALVTYVGEKEKHRSDGAVRALIGFFCVELFAVALFLLVPFYISPVGFGMVLASLPLYFLNRHMAGMNIDWSRWVWVSQTIFVLGALLCFAQLAIALSH